MNKNQSLFFMLFSIFILPGIITRTCLSNDTLNLHFFTQIGHTVSSSCYVNTELILKMMHENIPIIVFMNQNQIEKFTENVDLQFCKNINNFKISEDKECVYCWYIPFMGKKTTGVKTPIFLNKKGILGTQKKPCKWLNMQNIDHKF